MDPSTSATKLPARIQRLPKDRRGYPIPWNVLRGLDGEPFFVVNNDVKHFEALRRELCPICGETLGKWKWFVGGPRSAFDPHGWYLDLPGHQECEEFALATCPYLSAPRYLREVKIPSSKEKNLPPQAIFIDETVLPDRPEIFVSVASRWIDIQDRSPLLPYVRPVPPFLAFKFWRHGSQLSPAEGISEVRKIFGPEWNPPELEA
jgi:hypothetical protein